MDYNLIFDTAMEIGYQLAMSGAETFRIEESVMRIMDAYGAKAEVFAIPNSMTASVTTPDGEILTRLRRIGFHGNDLDTVERYSNLSRLICSTKPEPIIAANWVKETAKSRTNYKLPAILLGNMVAAVGFAVFFGAGWVDMLISALCGLLVGAVNYFTVKLKVNNFFSTLSASFLMAFAAYGFGALGIGCNADAAIIGALMMLVPGLIFTNAMRDIIFGDTNSGINRLVQVILIAFAICLGTTVARSAALSLFGAPELISLHIYSPTVQCIAAAVGCIGFCVLFNVHGWGILICALGGVLSWAAYCIASHFLPDITTGYFFAALVAASYAEIMARLRHFPAITYLVIAIFPLIPGAGIYYSGNFLADSNTAAFFAKSTETVAIAGLIAVGILLVSTIVRGSAVWKQIRK